MGAARWPEEEPFPPMASVVHMYEPAETLIRRKHQLPPPPEHLVERPRVQRQLAELIAGHRVVVISATAGSGKTTATASALGLLDRAAAWLTVDHTDVAPGRLLTYLEAALAQQLPQVHGTVNAALAAGLGHAEATGILAEAAADAEVVVVLDELERLGETPAAWAVIEALIRYAPRSMRLALLSRRDIPAALCPLPAAESAVVGEGELAFTRAEASDALARLGAVDVDPGEAVEATGGWVTGVLFEAWRAREHVAGVGGEDDPLYGYLSSHILSKLDAATRAFLVTTSVLDEVTPARAEALGLQHAGERLAALRAAHLPVTWSSRPTAMRCHSRFREYLLELLGRRDSREIRSLRRAHGHLLADERHYEEATEELLRAQEPGEALEFAERAIIPVIDRLDFGVAEHWLEALGDVAPSGASALTTAELMLALGRDDIRRGVRIADQLEALGERDRLARTSNRAMGLMAWCYMHAVRPEDVRAVMSAAEPGPAVDAVRYALCTLENPREGDRPVAPELTGGPTDALVFVAHYGLGRLTELTELSATRWVEIVTAPWRIAALRASGQIERALETYELRRAAGNAPIGLDTVIGPEVLIDAGRRDEAWAAITHAKGLARESGSLVLRLLIGVAEAKLLLRLDRDPERARAVIDRVRREQGERRFSLIAEMLELWQGLALLLEGRDAEAVGRLRAAVESMSAGERLLELPTAAAYLAEAEWRVGEEEAADRAADLALAAARRQGYNHVLLQALTDFPAVLSRRIDAEAEADSPWHELGRALIAQGAPVTAKVGASVRLKEFGRPTLVVDGRPERPRISKSYELLAYLAGRPGGTADRDELLDALFGGRADESTRAYLRQAVHQLRKKLPGEAGVVVEEGRVRLDEGLTIITDSIRFESELAEAARLQGSERLEATLRALALFDGGDYLEGVSSLWAEGRQRDLDEKATDARYEAAELAFGLDRYEEARELNERVLRADPMREGAWRLTMRIANALGDDDGVIAAYHGCEAALRELDAEPSMSTRKLLESLRR